MAIRLLLRGGLAALLGLALQAVPATLEAAETRGAGSPPRFRTDSAEMDLGDVLPGTKIEATFVIRNAGGQVLRLLSVDPG